MNICACGNATEEMGTRCRRCAALQELGLDANATDAEIKSAYRAHVKACTQTASRMIEASSARLK